jgi:hypothetical protein
MPHGLFSKGEFGFQGQFLFKDGIRSREKRWHCPPHRRFCFVDETELGSVMVITIAMGPTCYCSIVCAMMSEGLVVL